MSHIPDKPMILIIDNTAFAMGFNINLLQDQWEQLQIITTSEIYEEAIRNRQSQQFLEIAQNQGLIQIQDPSIEARQHIEDTALTTGDLQSLSLPDRSLIALAYDLKMSELEANIGVMSDDYAIQNVCAVLNLQIFTLFKQGIKQVIYWEIYCPRCFKSYPNGKLTENCPKCDCKLKRRPKKMG